MTASSEALTTLFLEELSGLDACAARRQADGALVVGPEDPDVRRILEAMAFFSARTRAIALEQTARAVRRIAAGTLDELLGVQPAAMMIECTGGEGIVTRTELPRGTLLRVETAEGRVGLFATTRSLVLEPFTIVDARMFEERGRLFVRIRLRSSQPQKGPVRVSFHVRRLDDYQASLALHDALERHLDRASVRFSADGPELPSQVRFGAWPDPGVDDPDDERGPLGRIRSFFHLPEQDLLVQLALPVPRSPWTVADVYLALDEGFPTNLSVSNDTFRLHVVPAENAWIDFAAPILWDGTKTGAPVRGARALLDGLEACEVRAVYRGTERGLIPVLPAALAQTGDTFEVELEGSETWLRLSLAGAFQQPCKVLPEVRWSQPGLWSSPPGRLSVSFQKRHIAGVTLRCLGPMRSPAPSVLAREPSLCLEVLSLRMRPVLGRRDLIGMLQVLGAGEDGIYRGFASLIDELECCEMPDPERRAAGIRRLYRLALRQRTPEEAPMVRRLAAQIAALLDSWTEDPVDTELTTHVAAPWTKALAGGHAA